MHLEVWQIAVLVFYSFFQMAEGISLGLGTSNPVFAGALTGLVVGDVKTGVIVGATLQLMILGVGTYGGASIPDMNSATIIGTVFGHLSGKGSEFGIALAIPVGLLLVNLDVVGKFANIFWQHRIDRDIERLNTHAITLHTFLGVFSWGLSRAIPVAIMLIFGENVVNLIVNKSPDWLMGGLKVSGKLLPVVGIAILLHFLPTKRFIPFLLIGFVFVAYLKVPMLGVALLGTAMALIFYMYTGGNGSTKATAPAAATDNESEEYDDGEYDE
jgi:PTS system mannose-specific IIC component